MAPGAWVGLEDSATLRIIRPPDHPKVWPVNRPRRFPIGEFHRPPLAFRATSGAEGKTHWRLSWTIVKIGADMEESHLYESAPAINSSGQGSLQGHIAHCEHRRGNESSQPTLGKNALRRNLQI